MDATFGWTASSEGIGIGVDFSMKSGLAEISLQLLFCLLQRGSVFTESVLGNSGQFWSTPKIILKRSTQVKYVHCTEFLPEFAPELK